VSGPILTAPTSEIVRILGCFHRHERPWSRGQGRTIHTVRAELRRRREEDARQERLAIIWSVPAPCDPADDPFCEEDGP
jgi:hypothetical protein